MFMLANLFNAAFLIPLPKPSKGFSVARYAKSGSALSPFTSSFANCGKSVPNFTKFLVDREGNVIKRFEPTVDMDEVRKEVEALLG